MPAFAPNQRRARPPPLQAARTAAGRVGHAVSGAGSPAIVLFSGAGAGVEEWRALYPRIERLGRVLAWNRPGVKGSDPPRGALTGRAVVALLRELLSLAALPPPYLLVGHSLGGLHANLFARLHPEDTCGVLLLDATHPRDHALLARCEPQFAGGLARVLRQPRKLVRPNLHAEVQALAETVRQVECAPPFPHVPLTVVTGGRTPPVALMSPVAAGARRAHQQELVRLAPHARHVIAQRSGHFPQLTQPRLVLDELAQLVARARAFAGAAAGVQ